ncbi:C-type natriuretic peptide [Pipistrellus kuhlii]|uniref:C-type natriuretic peptide n=1 Tax=Pipistrellus kuhlii TaxID=59472 RepID=A0A7J7XVL4_PIPKU|nr:C-type natriuretic peptide [Pipistrellus kuhlii]XP_036278040.1 C-type natriuretic peptide [Pipistrellus kuhlii]KAF6353741.1 natriuretic peptide C [Pipistrellus kuhlii]
MHLSQLLACVLLLTLLALWPSEAKPGSPSKGLRTPLGEVSAASQAESGSQRKRDKTLGGGGINLRGDRSRLLRDTKTRWARLLQEKPREKPKKKFPKQNSGNNCFGHKLDRIGAYSGLGC